MANPPLDFAELVGEPWTAGHFSTIPVIVRRFASSGHPAAVAIDERSFRVPVKWDGSGFSTPPEGIKWQYFHSYSIYDAATATWTRVDCYVRMTIQVTVDSITEVLSIGSSPGYSAELGEIHTGGLTAAPNFLTDLPQHFILPGDSLLVIPLNGWPQFTLKPPGKTITDLANQFGEVESWRSRMQSSDDLVPPGIYPLPELPAVGILGIPQPTLPRVFGDSILDGVTNDPSDPASAFPGVDIDPLNPPNILAPPAFQLPPYIPRWSAGAGYSGHSSGGYQDGYRISRASPPTGLQHATYDGLDGIEAGPAMLLNGMVRDTNTGATATVVGISLSSPATTDGWYLMLNRSEMIGTPLFLQKRVGGFPSTTVAAAGNPDDAVAQDEWIELELQRTPTEVIGRAWRMAADGTRGAALCDPIVVTDSSFAGLAPGIVSTGPGDFSSLILQLDVPPPSEEEEEEEED